jgi:hypothetical protein
VKTNSLFGTILFLLLLVGSAMLAVVGSCPAETTSGTPAETGSDYLAQWGVTIRGVRLTGAEHFVDFRFRVIDPEKAVKLMNRKEQAVLIDEVSKKALPVTTGKLGPLRPSDMAPKANRDYVILFSNLDKILKKGSKVTVVIGEFKAEGLTVE